MMISISTDSRDLQLWHWYPFCITGPLREIHIFAHFRTACIAVMPYAKICMIRWKQTQNVPQICILVEKSSVRCASVWKASWIKAYNNVYLWVYHGIVIKAVPKVKMPNLTSWLAFPLIHWGRVTHICVGKLTIIDSDNGLSPGCCQAIIWTNAGILLIGPLGTNFSEILIKIHIFSFKEMHLKMSPAKSWPFCLSHNVLTFIQGTWGLTVCDPHVMDTQHCFSMRRSWHGKALHITGPSWGESMVVHGFPSQRVQ